MVLRFISSNFLLRSTSLFPLLFCLSLLNYSSSYSQQSTLKLPKPPSAKPGEYDTVGVKMSSELAKDNVGLMENTIDPDTYLLGPGDIVTVFIGSLEPKLFDLLITPEARLVIPTIGVISVKGKTLAETEQIVTERVAKTYKIQSVSLSLKKIRLFKVMVTGNVRSPGYIPASPADRLSEVIERAGRLLFNAAQRNIIIKREGIDEPIIADLTRFYLLGEKSGNPTMQGGDVVTVPPYPEDEIIEISGGVNSPSKFEFTQGDKLSTILRFAQGFLPSAITDSVEIVRFKNQESETVQLFINASTWNTKMLQGEINLPNDIVLMPGDRVYVRERSNYHVSSTVAIKGAVHFAGRYGINSTGTTVADIIERAGGFTEYASLENGVLIRKKDSKEEVDVEHARLLGVPIVSMSESEKAYFREKQREVSGKIMFDFTKLNDKKAQSIFLKDMDSIFIPTKNNFVNIIGRVSAPGKILYNPNYSYLDYIVAAGGFSNRADESEALIVKQKGERYLASDNNAKIEPGDHILVPEIPESKTRFIDILTTTLTITAQIVTVVGVIFTLSNNSSAK
ncbi:MAG: SLBB domain-containing protein [Ignavibacteria bacterium]|nr:SLBB domain-containing protein [Ignavibacteria bacterium]